MPEIRITNSIRRLRFDRDEMTQQALADEVGCTRQTIAAIEKAKYAPSLELAVRIAIALGRPLADVFQVECDSDPVALGRPQNEPNSDSRSDSGGHAR